MAQELMCWKKKGAAKFQVKRENAQLKWGERVKIFEIESISLNAFGNPNQTNHEMHC